MREDKRKMILFKEPFKLDQNFFKILKEYGIKKDNSNNGSYQTYEDGIYLNANSKWIILVGKEELIGALEKKLKKMQGIKIT